MARPNSDKGYLYVGQVSNHGYKVGRSMHFSPPGAPRAVSRNNVHKNTYGRFDPVFWGWVDGGLVIAEAQLLAFLRDSGATFGKKSPYTEVFCGKDSSLLKDCVNAIVQLSDIPMGVPGDDLPLSPDAPRNYKHIKVSFNEYEYTKLKAACESAERGVLEFIRRAISAECATLQE